MGEKAKPNAACREELWFNKPCPGTYVSLSATEWGVIFRSKTYTSRCVGPDGTTAGCLGPLRTCTCIDETKGTCSALSGADDEHVGAHVFFLWVLLSFQTCRRRHVSRRQVSIQNALW